MKLEEREVMIRRITLQCEELQRENTQILTENGRLIDTVSVLEMSLTEVKMHGSREMNVLAPRVQELEYSTEALAGKVKRNTLDVDLMAGLVHTCVLGWLSILYQRVGPEAPEDGNTIVDWAAAAARRGLRPRTTGGPPRPDAPPSGSRWRLVGPRIPRGGSTAVPGDQYN